MEHECETMIDTVKMQDMPEKLRAYNLALSSYMEFLDKIANLPVLSQVNDKFANLIISVVSKLKTAGDRLTQFFYKR